MKASVIIPTFEKLERLKLVLCSLEKQTADPQNFEIIVVDDGSQDGTGAYIQSRSFPYSLTYIHKKNAGRAAARNTGVKTAKQEILIFIDDDTPVCVDFIDEHIKLQKEKNVVVHGMIREIPYLKFFKDPSNAVLYDSVQSLNVKPFEALKKLCISENDMQYLFYEKVHKYSRLTSLELIIRNIISEKSKNWYWLCFCGANVSLPKQWVSELNGFDEEYGTCWGCEDFDLGYRLMKKNYDFVYCDNATNYHIDHYRENYIEEHKKTSSRFYEKFKNENILLFQKFVENKLSKDDLLSIVKKSKL